MLIGWLTARELINMGLLVGDLCMITVLFRVLWDEVRIPGWLRLPYNQAAVSLLVYFIGVSVARMWGAVLLWQVKRGGDVFAIENAYPISMIGSAVSFVGLLLIVRTLAPRQWQRRKLWMSITFLTGGMTLLTYAAFDVSDEDLMGQKKRVTEEIQHLLELQPKG